MAPLNTILYNVASRARGISPELYGVEPPSYYVVALALAFSMAAPLALAALPMIAITAVRYPMRFAPMTSATTTFTKTESASPAASAHNSHGSQRAVLLALRVLPLYLWLGLLMTQPHKEERFLYPAYPLVCVNAAVTLYLIRACMEQACPTPRDRLLLPLVKAKCKKVMIHRSHMHSHLMSMLAVSLSRILSKGAASS